MSFTSSEKLYESISELYDVVNNHCNKVDEVSNRLKQFTQAKPEKNDYVKTDWHVDSKKKLAECKEFSDALKAWNKAKMDWPYVYKYDVEKKMDGEFLSNEIETLKPYIRIMLKNIISSCGYSLTAIRSNLKRFTLSFLSDENTGSTFTVVESDIYDGENK